MPKKSRSKPAAAASKQKGARKPAKKSAKAAVKKASAKKPAKAPKHAAKKPGKKAAKPTKATKPAKKAPTKKTSSKKAPAKQTPVKKTSAKPAPAKKARSKQVICPLSGLTVTPGKPRLSPATLRRLREALEEERARHLRQAEELQAEAEVLATERDQGDTQFDEESGEGDTVSVERERSLLLSASARQAVDEIDQALARIDNKTYGVCTPAGRPINLARLEAIPWADTCVECAQRVARRR